MLGIVYGRDAEIAEWVRIRAPHADSGFEKYVCIGVERDGELICGVVYNDYRVHSIHASIASTDPRWACRRTLYTIFAYPFVQLKVGRITTYCGASMTSVRRFNERLGFTQEGLLRRGFGDDDCVIFGMLREECRWLERNQA